MKESYHFQFFSILLLTIISNVNCVNFIPEKSGCQAPIDCQLAKWSLNQSGTNPSRATNLQGIPTPCLTASQSVYPSAITLFQDSRLLDKLSSFNMERIPERIVHTKGAGAHGSFIVTNDISQYTKAKFLTGIGKKTPVFVRFSTTNSEIASPDTILDAKGFAIKFYTEEGNHDLLTQSIGVFAIKDPMLFSSLNKSKKRNPVTNLRDRNIWWDFVSQRPETTNSVLHLFSAAGYHNGYRRIPGFGLHPFKFVNADGDFIWARFELRSLTEGGRLTNKELFEIAKNDTEYYARDLYNAIERGEFPKWNVTVRFMTLEQAKNYPRNPFDITRNWVPLEDFLVLPVGILTLDRNPVDYFTEVEQAGFSPGNMVPGIEPGPDKMLHARIFSYTDAQRYRIGVNGQQLKINRPLSQVNSYQRNGLGCYGDNGGGGPNYFPNSFRGPEPDLGAKEVAFDIEGWVDRYEDKDDFVVPRYFLFKQVDIPNSTLGTVEDLVDNIAYWLKDAKKEIRERVYENNFYPVSKKFGDMVRYTTEKAVREEVKNV